MPLRLAHRLRLAWARTSLVTRVTLWYTLLLGAVIVFLAAVVAGTLSRWIEADTTTQLNVQGQEVRVALASVAHSDQPFQASATRVLNEVVGRNVQASVWALDGHLIARTEGFYFPQEKFQSKPVIQIAPFGSGMVRKADPISALPARPALASSDVIGQVSDRLYVNVNTSALNGSVMATGAGRVATLVLALDGVPDALVATSDAYPDVPPIALPEPPLGQPVPRRAVVAISSSLDREAAGIANIVNVSAAVGSLALVLGAFIARRIARHSLRPIDGLAEASQRLAGGDLGTRVPVPPGRDEIARLARSFNDMAVQLDSAFAAQRAFVADASHELRTPLAALRGQVDVLRRALPEQPADADRLATSMRRELARLSRLVDDLLVLARLDALGSGALALRSVDVCSVAEDVCAQVRALPAAKGRNICLEAYGPVRITADGERLHQVMLNLLANAVEHTPAAGSANLKVQPTPDGAQIVVHDTGPGIPDSHLPHIFDRFYRVDGTRRRLDAGGAGLGLAIVRAIVEAHSGSISASNAPSGGAVFSVQIPSQP